MKGASLSDLHLGFRSGSSTTDGRNTREVDVERAWVQAVEQIVAEKVAIVTIAGDVFHHPRVSDYAKKSFLEGVRRLLASGAVVIVIQGNHDAGRTAEVLTPIMLAEGIGPDLYVVTEPERVRLSLWRDEQREDGYQIVNEDAVRITVSVDCFPFVVMKEPRTYKLEPDNDADVTILLMHAAVRSNAGGDELPHFYGSEQSLDIGALEHGEWDVIACGDFHEYRRLHPERLAFYSGAIERTSSNIWQEHAPKGWVLWDTETRTMEFREIQTRPMADIPFDADPTAEVVNATLEAIRAAGTYDGSLLRLKVEAFPLEEREHIDWSLVRTLQARLCQFHLDIRYRHAELPDGERAGRMTLAQEAAAFFADDLPEVRELVVSYLDVQADVEDLDEEDL